MHETGFGPWRPINEWRQANTVADGHSRCAAAIDAGVDVLVCLHDFADEDEAMEFAIANQRDRRNLTDEEPMSFVVAVDKLRQGCGPTGMLPLGGISGRSASAHETAEQVGTSHRKVEGIRAINDNADPEKTPDGPIGPIRCLRPADLKRSWRGRPGSCDLLNTGGYRSDRS